MTRTCIDCRHWYFQGGQPDYENTPGFDGHTGCTKGRWPAPESAVEFFGLSEQRFRALIATGSDCGAFELTEAAIPAEAPPAQDDRPA